ncbi:MAG TPA: tRNA uracil 4-sulfurtransferase ThiI [Candidatus Binataceae bacterium]|nr:tRNA uracil 4-sulfurtransferase ThiI [Candidatus Binataceae bacterium]
MRYLIGRYHEIALKGRNRWRFVEQLKRNLRVLMSDWALGPIHSTGPRLMVELPEQLPDHLLHERARRLFGLQNYSLSYRVLPELEAIKRQALACALAHPGRSFAVRTRREDKRFPLNSMQVDREVGGAIAAATGWKVDLSAPETTVTVEIFADRALIAAGKQAGAGGLPVGISGRGLALLSGGIDSPVAAWRMMRRGLALDYVHFHSYPMLSRASQDKARELAQHLAGFQGETTLYLAPFGLLQREIIARTHRPLRVILYRRFMLRVACALAARQGAQTLVTGESLGQVASQTLPNLQTIEAAATLPVMRPLVGMDKNEIVEQARHLGTFETSILPDQDCCTLFIPRHPETHARLAEVEAAESALDVARMVAEVVASCDPVKLEAYPRRASSQSPAALVPSSSADHHGGQDQG